MKVSSITNAVKPQGGRNGMIANDLKEQSNILDIEHKELITLIQQGRSILLENIKEGHGNGTEGVISSLYVGLDFDEEQATITRTEQALNELGIKSFLSYKTFSYTEQEQKHRRLLKFNRELNVDELKRVYYYLGQELPFNDKATEHIGRLWHGTRHDIIDTPLHVINADEFLKGKEIPQEPIVLPRSKKVKSIDLSNCNGLYDSASKVFENWTTGDHNEIYKWFYSAGVLAKEDNGAFFNYLIELTINNGKSDKVEEYTRYYNATLNNDNYIAIGQSILDRHHMVQYDIKYNDIYNILKDVKPIVIEQYLTHEHITHIDYMKHNLIVAPAGSGKTVSILTLMIEKELPTIFLVPTRYLVLDIMKKFGKGGAFYNKGYAFYCEGVNTFNLDSKVFIGTYDQYQNMEEDLALNFTNMQYQFFIDEGHECAEFFGMTDKTFSTRRKMIENIHRATILTATPYNLPNSFDNKYFFANNVTKHVNIIVTQEHVKTMVNEIIESSALGRVFVYLNYIEGIKKIIEKLQEQAPHLNTLIVTSDDDNIEELNENMNYDVVICTKVLNMGIDIRNMFKTSIYGAFGQHSPYKTNSVFQFASRDRDCKNYKIIYSGYQGSRIDINTPILTDLMGENSYRDKERLHKAYLNDSIHPFLAVSYDERNVSINAKTLRDLIQFLNKGWHVSIKTKDGENDTNIPKSRMITTFKPYYNEGHFVKDLYANCIGMDKSIEHSELPKNLRKQVNRTLNICTTHITFNNNEIEPEELLKDFDYISAFHITSLYRITNPDVGNGIDNVAVKNKLLEIAQNKTITVSEISELCIFFNSENWKPNNIEWCIANFIDHMNKHHIYFKKENKHSELYINKSVLLDIPKTISTDTQLLHILQGMLDKKDYITSHEKKVLSKNAMELGLITKTKELETRLALMGYGMKYKSQKINGKPVKVYALFETE